MRYPIRWHIPIMIWSATACSHVVDPPVRPERLPIVEAALLAGSTGTTVRIGWVTQSPDDLEGTTIEGATAATLTLSSETTGVAVPLTRLNDSLYYAALQIEVGHRYRLAGRIGEAVVHATTTVPGRLEIEAPRGDSIVLASADEEYLTSAIEYRWSATGATAYAADSAWFLPGQAATRATAGQLIIPRRRAGSSARLLRIVAVNRDLDDYLYRTPAPASNVSGAFGVFGAATSAERWLVTR